MPVAGWRAGLPTRCGMCLSEEIDYRDDGSAVCRACGAVTPSYWAGSKGTPSTARTARPRPTYAAARGPPPLAPPPVPVGTGRPAAILERSRMLLWAAVPVHVLAALIDVVFGGAGGATLAVGLAAQFTFAAVAALGALRLLASRKTFAMPMVLVGIVALVFSALVYGGIVGVVGGALLTWAWWRVR